MRVLVCGPLALRGDGGEAEPGGPRQRAVLGVLALILILVIVLIVLFRNPLIEYLLK